MDSATWRAARIGPFDVFDPEAQEILGPVRLDAERDVDRLVAHQAMNELKNRGVSDLLIAVVAVVDGLKGFPEAIIVVFPQTIVQTWIIHLIRHSMDFASWKDRKVLAGVLKTIYRAKDADAARAALEGFDASQWGQKHPAIAQSWR